MEDFDKTSQVTVLDCHVQHVFHSVCLNRWIYQEHNTCPVCRGPIIENMMGLDEYTAEQDREIRALRRDVDLQRLAECPFGWPF